MRKYLFGLLILLGFCSISHAEPMKDFVGFNVDLTLQDSDFKDLSAMGVGVIRVGFARSPFLTSTSATDLNEQAFKDLDRYIGLARKYKIRIVVDPHYIPGGGSKYTMKPSDEFWTNRDLQKLVLSMWKEIAKVGSKARDVVVGYDVLNEPAPPRFVSAGYSGCDFLNDFYSEALKTIREQDPLTPVVVEFPMALGITGNPTNQAAGASCIKRIAAPNIYYSFHMYDPGRFSHQGVLPGFSKGVSLYANRTLADVKTQLKILMQGVRDFQIKNDAEIYVGEFGVSRFAGAEGDTYIQQLVEIFDDYGWGWTYHSFRESSVWDPELSNSRLESKLRQVDSPRMLLLSSRIQARRK